MDYAININQLENGPGALTFRIKATIGNNQIAYLDYTEPGQKNSSATIQAFEVNNEYRDQGVGSQLISKLREICCSQHNSCPINVLIAPLGTYLKLEDLEDFYRKHGSAIKQYQVENSTNGTGRS